MIGLQRGRGFGSGLALVLLLAACADAGPPAGDPVEGYAAPAVVEEAGVRRVSNEMARETLRAYGQLSDNPVQLLFMAGRAGSVVGPGRVAWPDEQGARVVVFDSRGVVADVLQGIPPQGAPLTQPTFAVADGRGIRAVQPDGTALLFEGGKPVEWVGIPVDAVVAGGGGGLMAVTRPVLEYRLGPVRPGLPLVWLLDGNGEVVRELGEVTVPREAFLGNLVNTGWVTVDEEGGAFFASALRPEVIRYDRDGAELWRSTWKPTTPVEAPRFRMGTGTLTADYQVVQHGVAAGPGGLLYVLGAPNADAGPTHLYVFDGEGTLVRSGPVPVDGALYADAGGRVYAIPVEEALSRTGGATRTAFQTFDLPNLAGGAGVSLEAHRGKVVVVNFWASWCTPCRQEMPLLDAYAQELDPEEVVLLGVNEDVTPAAALAFLRELGGVSYPSARGGGRMKARYNYRGLPYTVVLDRELRLVKTFYGFGSTIDPIKELVRAEVAGADLLETDR